MAIAYVWFPVSLLRSVHTTPCSYYSNSNCIFIALNLHLKTDSRHTIQKKQKPIITNLRHSPSQHHGEILGKAEVRVDMLVQRDIFLCLSE